MKYKFFYFAPRILAIAYILFLALFALDVFEQGKPFWEIAAGFIIHLMPNFILALVLLIAWKKSKIGGVLFLLLAAIMLAFFKNPFWVSIILIGPLVLIGLLFLAQGNFTKQTKND